MNILLPVPQILQNPELPNGCEITSLCQVLNFLGYDADKCDLADNYLPRSQRWFDGDPDREYLGDPHLDDTTPQSGYYCFAGPVVQAATAFLSAREETPSYVPADLTGAEEAELIEQLSLGRPFIFWASLHFDDIRFKSYPLPGGGERRMFHTLHCMTACGVDDECFTVADPLDFNRRVPRDVFMKVYRQLGSRCVVLKKAGT